MTNQTDAKFMKIAIRLAKKGGRNVFPNPLVGAIVVKDGEIVGKGYHKYYGGPHAEVYALEQAGTKAAGATLYVSLEPCAHWGKTPPCVDLLISSKIARVVAASTDPNPKTAGNGFKKLSTAGIKVTKGTLKNEALKLNQEYFARFKGKSTYCIAKAAMSLDGKICTRTGDSKWISCRRSRELVHKLRSSMDAILVGINTVISDNPYLTSHGQGRNPVRVILDPNLRMPLNSNVLNNEAPTVIFTGAKPKQFKNTRVQVIQLKYKKHFNLKHVFSILNKMSIYSILIEGGGETIGSAIEADIVDELMFFISPKIVGGRDAKTAVEGLGVSKIADAIALKSMKAKKVGTDILITGKVR